MMTSSHGGADGSTTEQSSHGMLAMDAELKSRDIKAEEWAKEDLTVRKKYELKLLQKFDRSKVKTSMECWFLVDCNWLNAWSAFVNTEDGELPGPMSTKDLLDASNNPLPNLKVKIDYRGLAPTAYFILKQLHGADKSPDLPRYSIDIYKPSVPIERLVNIQLTAVTEANIQINKYRPKWQKWDLDVEEEEEQGVNLCCGLTREHLEAFIYWAIHCWAWSRKASGREKVSYRQYRPLKGVPDDSVHGNSQHNALHDSSTHSRASSLDSSRHSKADAKDDEEEDGSSSDEDQYVVAPADRNHERGTWLYSFTK